MNPLREFRPMLPAERPFNFGQSGWLYEIKFDGYRVLAGFGKGITTELRTRHGADATAWFPEVVRSLSSIKGGPYITDGEVCVLDEYGRSDIKAIQERARRQRWFAGARPVTYCIFDILIDRGADITSRPLIKRKAALDRLLKAPLPNLRKVSYVEEGARCLFEEAVLPLELEGLVAKRVTSIYQPGSRTSDWVKIKRQGAFPLERFKR